MGTVITDVSHLLVSYPVPALVSICKHAMPT